jgi:biopolymer transport protein ExbB/TolQ
MLFSGFTTELEAQFTFGYSFVSIMIIVLVSNLVWIIIIAIQQSRSAKRRQYFQAKYERWFRKNRDKIASQQEIIEKHRVAYESEMREGRRQQMKENLAKLGKVGLIV